MVVVAMCMLSLQCKMLDEVVIGVLDRLDRTQEPDEDNQSGVHNTIGSRCMVVVESELFRSAADIHTLGLAHHSIDKKASTSWDIACCQTCEACGHHQRHDDGHLHSLSYAATIAARSCNILARSTRRCTMASSVSSTSSHSLVSRASCVVVSRLQRAMMRTGTVLASSIDVELLPECEVVFENLVGSIVVVALDSLVSGTSLQRCQDVQTRPLECRYCLV